MDGIAQARHRKADVSPCPAPRSHNIAFARAAEVRGNACYVRCSAHSGSSKRLPPTSAMAEKQPIVLTHITGDAPIARQNLAIFRVLFQASTLFASDGVAKHQNLVIFQRGF